jgi:hypothetical protein
MKFTILVVTALLMLTACSEFQYYSSEVAPVISKGYGADYWLAEVYATRAMTPEQRQVTVKLWQQEYNNNPDTSNGIRLALLLAAGDESMRNPERALELLEWIDPDMENDGDRELILILRQFIDEQFKTEAALNDLKTLAEKKNRLINELEQQLQALTNIEQNIQQRENQLEAGDDEQ